MPEAVKSISSVAQEYDGIIRAVRRVIATTVLFIPVRSLNLITASLVYTLGSHELVPMEISRYYCGRDLFHFSVNRIYSKRVDVEDP